MPGVEDAITRYLAPRLPGARDLAVSHLLRIPGGASRETWMFKAVWHDESGRQAQEFVLRKDPPASLLDTDREAEYAYYSSFMGSAVPVPRMRWLERDGSVLGGPFFIMERITGAKLVAGLAIQAGWAVVMWLLAVSLWRRGIRRYQAVGG